MRRHPGGPPLICGSPLFEGLLRGALWLRPAAVEQSRDAGPPGEDDASDPLCPPELPEPHLLVELAAQRQRGRACGRGRWGVAVGSLLACLAVAALRGPRWGSAPAGALGALQRKSGAGGDVLRFCAEAIVTI